MTYHQPVLLEESVKGLHIQPGGIYLDLTFGGGGHSRRILAELGKKGKLLAFDQDPDAKQNIPDDPRFTFIHSNFRFIRNFLRYHNIEKADGIIADLGISSHQIDSGERGFSYLKDAGLDMRMNKGRSLNAARILNEYDKEALNRIFRVYGEIPKHNQLTGLILKSREKKAFGGTADFTDRIDSFLPKYQKNKLLSKIFQALRIEVNDEMGALREMLLQIPMVLSEKGRLVVISYHSAEDRLVKNFMKSGNLEGVVEKDFFGNVESPFKLISRNVIVPTEQETGLNPRARSAKLRIAEKI